jgi:hypothetical protein
MGCRVGQLFTTIAIPGHDGSVTVDENRPYRDIASFSGLTGKDESGVHGGFMGSGISHGPALSSISPSARTDTPEGLNTPVVVVRPLG